MKGAKLNQTLCRLRHRSSERLNIATESARPHAINFAPSHGVSFSPQWAIERALRLHRMFCRIDAALARGEKFLMVVRRRATHCRKPRRFRCAPDRQFRASFATIIRNYYTWRRCGRCPAALTLRFVPRKERITRESLRVFLDSCMATGITSMAAAFRSLPATAGSYCAYIRRIPENVKRTLRRLHRERRAVQRLARKARNLTEPRKPFNLPQAVSGHVDAAGNGCDAPSEALTGY